MNRVITRTMAGLLACVSAALLCPFTSSPASAQPVSFLRNRQSGRCIDVDGAPGTANGARLQLWDCELSGFHPVNGSGTDQRWIMTTGGFIRNVVSGKCVDVDGAPGNTNGARLQLWDCELSGFHPVNGSETDQRWVMTGDGFIRNVLSGRCIDVDGAPGTANGARLQLWDCELSGIHPVNGTVTDQRWEQR